MYNVTFILIVFVGMQITIVIMINYTPNKAESIYIL